MLIRSVWAVVTAINLTLYWTNIPGERWHFYIICYLDLIVQNEWEIHKFHNGKLNQLSFRRRIAMAILARLKPEDGAGHLMWTTLILDLTEPSIW
jgi:hypothetical protein